MKIFMYHRIVDNREKADRHRFCVHKEDFELQLKLLDWLDMTPITFQDYSLYRAGRLTLPKYPVIITFDDGYLDTYRHAVPLLNKYGMNATFFIVGNRELQSNVWDQNNGEEAVPIINDRQIRSLLGQGHEIGAHSMNHYNLVGIKPEKAWEEISFSKTVLQNVTSKEINTFAYPYGFHNKSVRNMVEKAGYDYGCGVQSDPFSFESKPYNIKRIEIHNRVNSIGFLQRLSGHFDYYDWLKWKSKKVMSA